jgi:hypothetical protein
MARASFLRWAVLALAGAAACGKTPIVSVEIVTPAGEDTFAGATRLRVRNATPAKEAELSLTTGGEISLDLEDVSADGDVTIITIDALDDAGTVLAHGATPAFTLVPAESYVRVYVGRAGAFGEAPMALAAGRTDVGLSAFAGLGALIVGGTTASGAPVADATVYNEYLHQVADAASVGVARAGLALVEPSDSVVLAFGGRTSSGVSSLLEGFDPYQGYSGVWVGYSDEGIAALARAHAPGAILTDGILIAGGTDATDSPLATAVQLVTGDSPAATALAAQLAAARVGHTVTAMINGGAGLVYGGATAADPVAELYSTSAKSFSTLTIDAALMRTRHTATLLEDGRVAVIGGVDADGLARGDVIFVGADGTATIQEAVLQTPRSGHTATLVGTTIVVAGGSDDTGALADAELVETGGFTVTATTPLRGPRTGHAAVLLASGTVLLAGGVDLDGAPLARLELYTPAQ